MLSYFTCDQVASDPKDPTNYYNDANYCDPRVRQALQAAEGRARPGRSAMRHRARDAHALPAVGASTTCSTRTPTCRRIARTASTGCVRQPAKIGPVLFSNTSPTYAQLKPVDARSASGDDGGRQRRDHRDHRRRGARRGRRPWSSWPCAGARPTSGSERPLRRGQGRSARWRPWSSSSSSTSSCSGSSRRTRSRTSSAAAT